MAVASKSLAQPVNGWANVKVPYQTLTHLLDIVSTLVLSLATLRAAATSTPLRALE